MNIQKLKQEQQKLAKKVLTKDSFGKIKHIGGCDQAFAGNKIISAIVVLDYKTLEEVEKRHVVVKSPMPYVPGLLSYREAPAVIKAYKKLKTKPDILMVDGNGILHPRRAGMASHVGVTLGIPTIGVAKSLLLGKIKGNKVFVDKELRAIKLKTGKSFKPVYVSPGHKVSLNSSVKIVKACLTKHKLPEPLHLAHGYANKVKQNV